MWVAHVLQRLSKRITAATRVKAGLTQLDARYIGRRTDGRGPMGRGEEESSHTSLQTRSYTARETQPTHDGSCTRRQGLGAERPTLHSP